jgi:hypothetical protein
MSLCGLRSFLLQLDRALASRVLNSLGRLSAAKHMRYSRFADTQCRRQLLRFSAMDRKDLADALTGQYGLLRLVHKLVRLTS